VHQALAPLARDLERELAESRTHVTRLQFALDFWMPSIASEESSDGERAAQDAILQLGLDKDASDCYGDRLCAEIEALRKDKERLDSGVMVYTTFDEFGERIKVESRGNDLRAMIDEGIARRDRDTALASKEGA
jgi:hypothetical protein